MKNQHQPSEVEALGLVLSRSYDAVPRDGPAVFVANTDVLDEDGTADGAWLDASSPPDVLKAGIEFVTGQAAGLGGWAVIDQVGLGPIAVDEDWPLAQLSLVA